MAGASVSRSIGFSCGKSVGVNFVESRAEVSQFAHHSVGVNANYHVSDSSDMERIVSVTEDMKHDVSVGDMACDVDVTSGDGNAKKT